ncbi:NTP transferase domain-containing protein [Patescibacteria group bacterium]|nr:NTP transferase domain-containing protein [Patescibacteria group bacterium]MBU1703436.1 NTP transferase domain-containing protein [Patescibacteria group bacterium]MBU1954009.1 NTP transferase domain-containing protein [Patescibacteria group bacterium]
MKVVLLAAGRSKRLKPIEDKNFLNFLGKPLVQIQLEQLAAAGFDDFVLVGGSHNLEKLRELVTAMAGSRRGGAARLSMKIEVVEQENLDDGMAGAVLSAASVASGGPVLIVSGNDIVEDSVFTKINKDEFVGAAGANDGFLVAKEVGEYFPGGYLQVENGFIKSIVEKPGAGNEPGNLVNLVIHYFKDIGPLVDALKKTASDKDDRYEQALDSLMKGGLKFKALPYNGFWQPIKYPWHVLAVMEHFLAGIKPKTDGAEIAESAVIRGNVYLEDGVKVLDHATINGPAYIGRGSIVAGNALVRGSCIGANCVVGYATEVARSFLGDRVWTHSNYIGDSVIGNNVSFGAGTVTGNLRFDEGNISMNVRGEKIDSGRNKFGLITGDHVRSGINTSFMPGIKIGTNVCVGAGLTISMDIENNKFVTGKTELVQHENKLDISVILRP